MKPAVNYTCKIIKIHTFSTQKTCAFSAFKLQRQLLSATGRCINNCLKSSLYCLFWQCAQAGGEHPLFCGSPGQPEAHRLLPEVSVRRWTPRPRQEKERQEGPGWSWRSWRWGGGLRRMLYRSVSWYFLLWQFSIKCLVYPKKVVDSMQF